MLPGTYDVVAESPTGDTGRLARALLALACWGEPVTFQMRVDGKEYYGDGVPYDHYTDITFSQPRPDPADRTWRSTVRPGWRAPAWTPAPASCRAWSGTSRPASP
jgi:hypothetical protein